MTPETIARLRELLAASTPGPLVRSEAGGHIIGREQGTAIVWADAFYNKRADLIVAAVNALPALLDERERQKALIDVALVTLEYFMREMVNASMGGTAPNYEELHKAALHAFVLINSGSKEIE